MATLAWLLLAPIALGMPPADMKEPETGVHFSGALRFSETPMACTGVDYHSRWLMRQYAIGHYGDATARVYGTTPDDIRRFWVHARVEKAIVIKFVREYNAEALRTMFRNALRRGGYDGANLESFVGAFERANKPGSELVLHASPRGALTVYQDGEALDGVWEDLALVRALWANWLGPQSPVAHPNDLVALSLAPLPNGNGNS